MTKQEEIREGIARNAYIWASFTCGEDSIEPLENLSAEKQKVYFTFAHQLAIFLDRQGVVIKVERELPDITDGCDCEVCQHFRQTSAIPHQVLLSAGYAATKPLIEVK